ncbi:MAG: hypothetical protein V4555_16475 [Acidobacteriota bacterium]
MNHQAAAGEAGTHIGFDVRAFSFLNSVALGRTWLHRSVAFDTSPQRMSTKTPENSTGIQPMLTSDQVAVLISQSRWLVNKMARLKQIPGARRIGRQWRFCPMKIQEFVEWGKVK